MQPDETRKIIWPAVIKYRGDNELLFVSDNEAWESDPDLRSGTYDEFDILIDSSGSIYYFVKDKQQNRITFVFSNQFIDLAEFTLLVREHLFYMNQCCIAKVELSDYREGMRLVGVETF